MKNIESLSVDISKYCDKVIDNLIKAQRDTAKQLHNDIINDSPSRTGAYKESIKLSDTVYENNRIATSIYTDAMVYDSAGRGYNLGSIIEYGTKPHTIEPAKKNFLKWKDENGKWRFAKIVFHPGTAENPVFQRNLQKNIALYKSNIAKALKEAK